MIMIYSTKDGRLYTDEKQHFYLDEELLREKALATRTEYLLNQIARTIGFKDYSEMVVSFLAQGVTEEVLKGWILDSRDTLIREVRNDG
jgi:hypothetical protein